MEIPQHLIKEEEEARSLSKHAQENNTKRLFVHERSKQYEVPEHDLSKWN